MRLQAKKVIVLWVCDACQATGPDGVEPELIPPGWHILGLGAIIDICPACVAKIKEALSGN